MAKTKAGDGKLTLVRFHAEAALGIEDLTIDLADVSVIEGTNAAGKSSVLKLIRSCLGIDRTSLGRLARLGEDGQATGEPEVEVLLVGDDREVRVSRKGAGSPEVRERVGEDWRVVPRPVEWLRQVLDVEAANPALWLAADDEARATAVLAAMPLKDYDRAEALRAAGLASFRLPTIPSGLHPLEDLEMVEAAVFDSRTAVNREQRAEADAAVKLLADLPAEAPRDSSDDLTTLEVSVEKQGADIARAERAIEADEREKLQAADAELAAATAKIGAQLAEDTAALRNRAQAALADAGARTAEAQGKARQERQEAAKAITEASGRLGAVREELAALRERQRGAESDRRVRQVAAEAQAKADAHEERSRELTAGLEALKRYKLELAGKLPVKGLSVVFDEKGRKSLRLDGVPLATLNTGRLNQLAVEVSLLRSASPKDGRPYAPLVLLDGIESLSSEARAALLREVAGRGAQIVAACVTDGPLRVLRGEEALKA